MAYQDRNPEVHVDIHRPDVDINDQIVALKLITKKLESAHKGQNVEWPSTSNCKFYIKFFLKTNTLEANHFQNCGLPNFFPTDSLP